MSVTNRGPCIPFEFKLDCGRFYAEEQLDKNLQCYNVPGKPTLLFFCFYNRVERLVGETKAEPAEIGSQGDEFEMGDYLPDIL